MTGEETNKKEDTTKLAGSGCGPMGQGILEMMKACCGGEGGIAECASMMKDKMAAMANKGCCGQGSGKS
jgi:hypothetical protein